MLTSRRPAAYFRALWTWFVVRGAGFVSHIPASVSCCRFCRPSRRKPSKAAVLVGKAVSRGIHRHVGEGVDRRPASVGHLSDATSSEAMSPIQWTPGSRGWLEENQLQKGRRGRRSRRAASRRSPSDPLVGKTSSAALLFCQPDTRDLRHAVNRGYGVGSMTPCTGIWKAWQTARRLAPSRRRRATAR